MSWELDRQLSRMDNRRIKVYYWTPGMDPAYDVVFRYVVPELTVHALAEAIKREFADEQDPDEEWVVRWKRELVLPTMTLGQLREQNQPGKKLKIMFVTKSENDAYEQKRKSTASHEVVRTRSVSGERRTGVVNSMMNMTRASSSTDLIMSGDDMHAMMTCHR